MLSESVALGVMVRVVPAIEVVTGTGGAVGECDGGVVRSGLDRLVKGDGDGRGDRDVDGVVGGIDRGDGSA